MGANNKSYFKETGLKIEVIEFYPALSKTKKPSLLGTLHIYLVEEQIDIRGVFVFRKPDGKFKFMMPHKFGKDKETGNSTWYPILTFTSQRKNKELAKAIYFKGSEYVKSYLNKCPSDVCIDENLSKTSC